MASLVDAKEKTLSRMGRIVPASISEVISVSCAPVARIVGVQRDWARDDDLFDTSYVADPYAISDETAVRELHSADVGRACRHVLPLQGAHRLSASASHCACRAG
jgi:hypothetical protein